MFYLLVKFNTLNITLCKLFNEIFNTDISVPGINLYELQSDHLLL